MRLAIIPEGPVAFDGQRYLYSKGERKYIDDLAAGFSRVTICAYAFRPSQVEYATAAQGPFESPNLEVLELPMCRRPDAGLLAKAWQFLGVTLTLARNIRRWDLLYLFLPGYPSAVVYLLNRLTRRPYFVYLADEWVQASPTLFKWSGRRLLYGPFLAMNRWLQRRIVADAFMVITAGRMLYERFRGDGKPVYETAPRMTLRAGDVVERADTCLGHPVRLLYVGDLRPDKGLDFLLEALRLLGQRGRRDLILAIAGTGVLDGVLRERAAGLPGTPVRFLGYVAKEKDLLALYRASDVFVLPSLSEGFPRVLYEAMSQSVPAIATTVGGVPYLLEHERDALLVPPADPEALARAIERMVDDDALRRRLIRNARELVKGILAGMEERQVLSLLRRHCPSYRAWVERAI